jgi:hypothetical protein
VPRFFNTTGPCRPDKHYMLPPEDRLVRAQLDRYIRDELYWVLHAPRQTGKTTFLQSWMRSINAGGEAVACYVSVERCQQFPLAEEAIPAVCEAAVSYASAFLERRYIPSMPAATPSGMLDAILRQWAALVAPKPLVILFDEVDVLVDQAMVSFLRQLRGGFAVRGVGTFPVSVALVGMRDLRDYLIRTKEGIQVNPGSPFNIKEDSVSLSNFSQDDVFKLAGQHTAETGQVFTDEALQKVYDLTRGQPWLTNALLKKCVMQIRPDGEPVEPDHVEQAEEMLIAERAVHLDSLAERLRDPRIKRIVELILTGGLDPELMQGDDFLLSQDMGLVTLEDGTPSIANPIYREVIARVLSRPYQLSIPAPEFPWRNPDGTLDIRALLEEFQKFWRRHADLWEAKADYTEAFPHLLLMAFLQRVVNSGGRIEREYAAGRGRVDLIVEYAGRVTIIEIKLVHPQDGRDTTVREGLRQLGRYRDTIDPHADAVLVVFDRTPEGRRKSWEERLTWQTEEYDGREITVVGG